MKMKSLILILVTLVMASLAQAAERVTLTGDFTQGGLVLGKTLPGTHISFDGIDVRVSDAGDFVFGFHRDDPAEMALELTYPDGQQEKRMLTVEQRDYNIQRIDGLDQKKVTPPESVLKRIRADGALVKEARKIDRAETWFLEGFIWPSKGRISGIYGSQRILNGQPRQPHYGIDVAAKTGTPVVAPASGIVTVAHPDMYFSGGTIILDHGHGLASGFLHLEELDVEVGQFVKKGEQIGTVGATGRATGPHLDWRINWFGKRIDPAFLVPEMPVTN